MKVVLFCILLIILISAADIQKAKKKAVKKAVKVPVWCQLENDWGMVTKTKGRVNVAQFVQHFLYKTKFGLHARKKTLGRAYRYYLWNLFRSATHMMPWKTNTLGAHCFGAAARNAREFYSHGKGGGYCNVVQRGKKLIANWTKSMRARYIRRYHYWRRWYVRRYYMAIRWYRTYRLKVIRYYRKVVRWLVYKLKRGRLSKKRFIRYKRYYARRFGRLIRKRYYKLVEYLKKLRYWYIALVRRLYARYIKRLKALLKNKKMTLKRYYAAKYRYRQRYLRRLRKMRKKRLQRLKKYRYLKARGRALRRHHRKMRAAYSRWYKRCKSRRCRRNVAKRYRAYVKRMRRRYRRYLNRLRRFRRGGKKRNWKKTSTVNKKKK